MPDLDSGHIFLTTLAPIKSSAYGGRSHTSSEQNVRIALAKMPTAMQSPATQRTGLNSPFARNKRNHLARMFVLNDVVYNGRVGSNAVLGVVKRLLGRDDSMAPQHVDRLNASYLVFCADIDAITADGAPLPTELSAAQQREVRRAYAKELWRTMELELQDVYSNCEGFEDVDTADDFADYLEKCHVETTMPFHDYYLELPKFHDLPVAPLLIAVAGPAAIAIIALLMRILGMLTIPLIGLSTFWTFVAALALTFVAGYLAVRFAIKNGEKPLAPGKYDDLPSVLKALYMQQKFADFMIEHQGCSAQKLHDDFGAFLKATKPSDRSGPTQEPGVVSVKAMDETA